MLAVLLPILLRLAAALPAAEPTYAPIRECFTGNPDTTSFYLPYIRKFQDYLTEQPARNISHGMGGHLYRQNYTTPDNATVCLQLQTVDWNCLYDLPVTGKGLALVVESIADLCPQKRWSSGETGGPFGFGYYMDIDTGNSYQQSLWAILSTCGGKGVQSACGMVTCQNNETHWYGNPMEDCPANPPATATSFLLE
ncbi:hypothetical protein K491DRAFT_753502 [Lophiostoma macrostomum CBS 122681]|uniref:Uncharacterized protein n=1 Tax=Lophiostoma macrostomum CBS 122681 TaxID=1314788 RepID=A0A6A6TRI9_9PLEO|nr:hypothetical protein K491DRAFT_753502 [Lophiostoma macrostomum CBS 122681]